jgi:hypothetical protein
MNIKLPGLPISVLNIRAHHPPTRALEISCDIRNPAPFDISILDAWIGIETDGGLRIAEGKIFQTMHNRVDPAIIPTRGTGLGAFHIPLPAHVLGCIEEQRAGADVKLLLSSRVLVSKVLMVNDDKILGVPFETKFTSGSSEPIEHILPQSEWLKILKSLAWSELELLEVPFSKLRPVPPLARAAGKKKGDVVTYIANLLDDLVGIQKRG